MAEDQVLNDDLLAETGDNPESESDEETLDDLDPEDIPDLGDEETE